MSQFELLNNIPGVEDLTNDNAETVSGGAGSIATSSRDRNMQLQYLLLSQAKFQNMTFRYQSLMAGPDRRHQNKAYGRFNRA